MKRFFLIFSFLYLFCYPTTKPISAQTPTPIPTEEVDDRTDWQKFWDSIGDLISNIFATSQKSGVAKTNYQVSTSDDKSDFTNYNAKDKDSITRSSSSSTLAFKKGTILKKIIEGTYTDYTIAYLCNNVCSDTQINSDCSDIKYSHLVHHFYKKGKKILYDPSDSKNPIDYNTEKMDSYDYEYHSDLDSCYQNLYSNMPKIPKGELQGQDNAAPASSKELNDGLRTFISASFQTTKPSATISSQKNIKILINDNDLQQRTMFSNFIPAKSQTVLGTTSDDVLGVSTDTKQLKELFTNYLHPQSWQDKSEDFVERDDYDSNWSGYGGGTSTGTCNAKKSHCRGMSQYGALGLSQSDKNYQEILKFYYGSDSHIKKIDTSNTDIKVNITDTDSCPDGSSLNVEDYLRGLGEMPDYWGKNSKGGFQAMKAQVVAARTYAYMRTEGFTKSICNTSRCQVFKCSNIGKKPYLDKAISETEGEILVDTTSDSPFTTEYARSFCGPSKTVTYSNHTIKSVNGEENLKYETQARNGEPPFCK